MALIDKDNHYIILKENGEFIIYKNKEARDIEKTATKYEEVLNKYDELINDIDEEYLHYCTTKQAEEYNNNINKIITERDLYISDYNNLNYNNNYPIISKYIKDVKNSLKQVICQGSLCLNGKSAKECYVYAKENKIWEDVKDDS